MEFNTTVLKTINKDSHRFWVVLVGVAIVICVLGVYLWITLGRITVNIDAEVTKITELEVKIDSLRIKMEKETERAELFIELYKKCIEDKQTTQKKDDTDYD